MARYRLNHPDVIQETLDGEVIIVHTTSGLYYNLDGTGAFVWNALLAGHTPEQITTAYSDDSGEATAAVTATLDDFVRQLEKEGLLLASDTATGPEAIPQPAQPFSAPTLNKFTDMQELLLVDPIHEVDPRAGWPELKDSQ